MPDNLLPEFEPYEVPKNRRVFQNVAIPLMALAETLSSRGKSPGTTAFTAGKSLRQMDLDEAQRRRQDYSDAIKRRLQDAQLAGVEATTRGKLSELEKEQALARKIQKGMSPEEAYEETYPVEFGKQISALNKWSTQQKMMLPIKEASEKRTEDRKLGTEKRAEERKFSSEERKASMSSYRARGKIGEEIDTIGLSGAEMKSYEQGLAEYRATQAKNEAALQKQRDKEQGELRKSAKQVAVIQALGKHLPASGRVGGGLRSLGAMAGLQPRVKGYQDMADAFVGNLAHVFGGEVGRLTDQDVARAKLMVYKVTDTPDERQIKQDVWSVLGNPEATLDDIMDKLSTGATSLIQTQVDVEVPEVPEVPESVTPETVETGTKENPHIIQPGEDDFNVSPGEYFRYKGKLYRK